MAKDEKLKQIENTAAIIFFIKSFPCILDSMINSANQYIRSGDSARHYGFYQLIKKDYFLGFFISSFNLFSSFAKAFFWLSK